VIARSHPRPPEVSPAAAHFELATHLWGIGRRDLAIGHFKAAHELQRDNWTYKRQAYSAGRSRALRRRVRPLRAVTAARRRDRLALRLGFYSEVATLDAGEYYPNTMP
jgi:hypothetical protein